MDKHEVRLWIVVIKRAIFNPLEKLRTSRPAAFATDLDLHSYYVNESCFQIASATINSSTIINSQQTSNMKKHSIQSPSEIKEFDWKWLQDEIGCKGKFKMFSQF